MYIPALDIDYWKSHYDIKSLHNLERLIKFYRAILDKGTRDLTYSERHHMIPSSMNVDEISNSINIIVLTAREHFIAHLVLSKIFKETSKEYHQMNLAIFRMCHSNTSMNRGNELIISSRLYERFKLKYSEAISYSNSTRDCKGKVAGIKNPCYGKKLYHKDNKQLFLLPEQVEEYESNGWTKGGLHFTKEHRERISKSLKGKKVSDEARENMCKAQQRYRDKKRGVI